MSKPLHIVLPSHRYNHDNREHGYVADHDNREHGYVAVKVCSQNPISIKRELAALEHLTNLPKTKHPGRECIRTSLDQFELTTTDLSSRFQCFVFEPMSESVWEFRQRMPMLQVHEPLVKGILGYVLRALDYLHTEAKVVHAGLSHLLLPAHFHSYVSCVSKIFKKTIFSSP